MVTRGVAVPLEIERIFEEQQSLAKLDISQKSMAHKVALWVSKQLPPEHPLLN
jgi:hypothetical protein